MSDSTDPTGLIDSARRKVATRITDAGELRVLSIERTYDAGIGDVWDACTDAERLARWFAPVSGDLRLTGALAGEELRPEEEWAATEGGKQFMTLSSRRWCDAGIAGGMDRATALAAAECTANACTADSGGD